jgi:hypothetical protein
MSYAGPGAIYRTCLMCGRPFWVYRYRLQQTNGAKFCSKPCYFEARRAFTAALSDGRLDVILTEEREAAIRARASRKPDEFMARKLAAGEGRKIL